MNESYIFLAEGFEETEAITILDILRQARMKVTAVSMGKNLTVKGGHNITVHADKLFEECDFTAAQWLILPGGSGAQLLIESNLMRLILVNHAKKEGKIAAICSSPAIVLAPLGILDGKTAVSYPSLSKLMTKARIGSKPIEKDGNIITGSGTVASVQFALAIIAETLGKKKAEDMAKGLLLFPEYHEFYF